MVRGSQEKWGLWSRVAQCYTLELSTLRELLWSSGKIEGIRYRPPDKAKVSGKIVCQLLVDTGRGDLVHCHQRRARLLQGSSSPGLSPVLTLEELMAAEFLSDLVLSTKALVSR